MRRRKFPDSGEGFVQLFAMKTNLSLGLIAYLLILPAQADSRQWSGDASGDWTLNTNWQGNVFPSFGVDFLVFNASSNKNLNQNFGAGLNVQGLIFESPNYILSGNRINFAGGMDITARAGGLTTMNLPTSYSSSGCRVEVNSTSTLDINGVMSGTGGIEIAGQGFVRFDAAMTYLSKTQIDIDSNLIVNGSTAGSLDIKRRGTLHGSGIIGIDSTDDVLVEGNISPGDPQADVTGDLAFNGDLTFATDISASGEVISYSRAFFDLQGNSAGVSYDQIDAAGAVIPGDARIALITDRGFPVGTVFTLINKTSIGAIASSRFALENGSEISENSVFTFGLNSYRFSYLGGTGNDFTATVVASVSNGANAEWVGDFNQLWSNPLNWSGNSAPIATQTLVFGSIAAATPLSVRMPINDLGGNPFALSFTASGYSLTSAVIGGNELTLSGGITSSHGSGTNTIENDLILAASQSYRLTGAGNFSFGLNSIQLGGHTLTTENTSSGTLRINSPIQGSGNFIKTGSGLVQLGGATVNGYTGTTTVSRGELRLTRPANSMAIPGDVTVGGGGFPASLTTSTAEQIADVATVTLATSGNFNPAALETIGGLIFNGGILTTSQVLAIAGPITTQESTATSTPLQVNGPTRDWTVAAGKFLTLNGPLTYSPPSPTTVAVVKKGLGTLVVTGSSAAATLRIDQGTLQLDTTSTSTLGITLSGGTLSGSGRASRIISGGSGGTINPATGTATAVLENTQLSLTAAVTLAFDLNGTTAGSGHDQLDTAVTAADTSGTVNLGGATLALRQSIVFPIGTAITLIRNDGTDAVSGTFAGLTNGATVRSTFNQYTINYSGGTGNDVVLTATTPSDSTLTRTWDGGGVDQLWSSALNWTDDTAPQPGDRLVFPSGIHLRSDNDYPVDFTFGSISFTGTPTGSSVRVINGTAIRLLGNLSSNVAGLATQSSLVNLPITFLASANISNTSTSPLHLSSTITATGILTFRGDSTATRRQILFSAGSTLAGNPSQVRLEDNAQVDFGTQPLTHTGTTVIAFGLLNGSVAQSLRADLIIGTGTAGAEVNLTGSPTVMAGNLFLNPLGKCFITGGTISCATVTITGGSLDTRDALNASVLDINGGSHSLRGGIVVTTLNLSGGLFPNLGNIAVTGIASVSVNLAPFNFAAATLIQPSGTITVRDNCALSGTATIGGTLTSRLLDSGNLVITNGTVETERLIATTLNQSSGTLTVASTTPSFGSSTISGTATISGAFTIERRLTAGVLNITGGSVQAAEVVATTLLTQPSGSLTVMDTATVSGTATIAGTLSTRLLTADTLAIVNGSAQITEVASVTNSITVDGTDTLTCGSLLTENFTRSGGTFAVTGDLQLRGDLEISAGTTVIGGRLTFGPITTRTYTALVSNGSSITTAGAGGVDSARAIALNKTGNGTLTVTTTLNHLTQLGVNGGILKSTAPDANGILRTHINGGTLDGRGQYGPVTVTTTSGSRIAPGSPVGILRLSSYTTDLTGSPAAPQLDFELNGPGIPGVFHDQLEITGQADFLPAAGTLVNLILSPSYTPLVGTEYVLIKKTSTGPLSGALFNSAGIIANGSESDLTPTIRVRFSYTGGDGNDLTATVITSPAGDFRVWDGGGLDAKWTTAANWAGDLAPLPHEALRFPSGALQLINNNDFPADTPFTGLRIESAYTLTGNRALLKGSVQLQLTGTATLALPLLIDQARTIRLASGNLSRTGTTTLNPAALLTLTQNSTGVFEITGPIQALTPTSVDLGLILDGTGNVQLNSTSNNTYLGETWLKRGVLELIASRPFLIPTQLRIGGAGFTATVENPGNRIGTDLILEAGGTHILVGSAPTESLSRLIMRGGTSIKPVNGTLTIVDALIADQATTSTLNHGLIFDVSSPTDIDSLEVTTGSDLTLAATSFLNGQFHFPNLRKTGGGTVRFSTSAQASIDCREGTFILAGSATNIFSGTTTLNGGIISGNGTLSTLVGKNATIDPATGPGGGTLAPSGPLGTGTGRITISTDFLPATSSRLAIKIGGTTAATLHDQLQVNGTLDLNRSSLDLTLASGFTPAIGQAFTLINSAGSSTPSPRPFTGIEQDATFTATGFIWSISYTGGTGNDVILTARGAAPITTPPVLSNLIITPARPGSPSSISASLTGGPPNTSVFLEASSDLGQLDPWETLLTIPLDATGSATLTNATDPNSTALPRNFFRLRLP